MPKLNLISGDTLTIETDGFGKFHMSIRASEAEVRGMAENDDGPWVCDTSDYSGIRDFKLDGHEIIEKFNDGEAAIKCVKCGFSKAVPAEREFGVYAYLHRESCESLDPEENPDDPFSS